MRCAMLGFAAGIAFLQMQAQLPAAAWLAALCALAAVSLLIGWRLCAPGWGQTARSVLFAVAGVCGGFAWGGLVAQQRLAQELPQAWEGRDITLIGTIDSLPDRFERGVRFHFHVETIVAQGDQMPVVPSRLALAWYAPGAYGASMGSATAPVARLQPGERWQLTVRLKRPHGNANPHGFDYEAWLLGQNLRATGVVRAGPQLPNRNKRLQAFVWTPGHVVDDCRGWLRDRILAALPAQRYAGVIVALVIGDQRAIEQSDWTVFNRTGVAHLMAISGLHITMVAGLFAAVAGFLWRRSFFTGAQLPLRWPTPKVAVLAGMASALLYVLLAGFGIPAQRTLYMLSMVGLAYWTGRLTLMSHVLCLALAVVLLLDPWAVLWPGFWLSFGAVAIILYALSGRTDAEAWSAQQAPDAAVRRHPRSRMAALWRSLRTGALTQYAVTLGLLPLTLLLFGQYSLISPLANAIAIPLVTLLVAPLSLLGSVLPAPLSEWVLLGAHGVLAWLAQVLSWFASQPFAVWRTPLPSAWMFVLALAGTLLLLAPRGWPVRWLGLFGWLPLIVNGPSWPEEGQLRVTAFDVGQGMALLVETSHHRLLYDTGPVYSPHADGVSRVILPYLRARGIDRLDAVVISHGDSDHAGGALTLFREIAVDRVYSSLSSDSPIVRAASSHQRCVTGQHWQWDAVAFDMLYPAPALYASDKWQANAHSCVLKIRLGKQAILLPGDIEAVQEDELVHRAVDLRADVLLAPHHGSGTSSTPAFLDAVHPQIAVFQVGYRNRYHHPKPAVLARYTRLGVRSWHSDASGAILLQFDQDLTVRAFRQEHARYWYGR